ncbi:g8485 [Coccomyxa elongata]
MNSSANTQDHSGHEGSMGMMMMQMYFTASTHVTLWLKQWHTHTSVWYAVSLLGLLALALIQEFLSSYRASFARRLAKTGPLDSSSSAEIPLIGSSLRAASGPRVVVTVLYALNVAISYLLMLAVMTYNVGYFVVIVLGLAAGHFIFFGPASPLASADACCAPQVA